MHKTMRLRVFNKFPKLVSFIFRNGNIALENRNRKTEAKQDFCH